MAKKKRNITVTISPEAENIKQYDLRMCLYDESGIELHFADEIAGSKEVKIIVREIIKIPASDMKEFALNVVNSLIRYEKEFNNGLGLPIPDNVKINESDDDTSN